MTIFLTRHGESAGNAEPLMYGRLGDAHVGLTDLGWRQTIAAGDFLGDHLHDLNITEWPRLWYSSLQRTRESLSGILHGMRDARLGGDMRAFQNPDLVEQNYGWLPYLTPEALQHEFKEASVDDVRKFCELVTAFSRMARSHSKFTAFTPAGESPQLAYGRVDQFFSTLRRDLDAGVKNHIVVTHGATIKAFMMRAFHLPMTAWDRLQTPGNSDVFRIDADPVTNRLTGIVKVYDGVAQTPVNLDPLAGLRPERIADLPQVPPHLR